MFNPDWLESDPVSTFICQGLTRQNNKPSLTHTHTHTDTYTHSQVQSIHCSCLPLDMLTFPAEPQLQLCAEDTERIMLLFYQKPAGAENRCWGLVPGYTQARTLLQSQFNNCFRVTIEQLSIMTDTKAGLLVVTEHRHGGKRTQSWTENLQYLIFQQMPHITHNDVISDSFFFSWWYNMFCCPISAGTPVFIHRWGGFVLCFNSAMTHIWKEGIRVCGWIIRLRSRRESGLE